MILVLGLNVLASKHVEFTFATQLSAALNVIFGFIDESQRNDPSNNSKWRKNHQDLIKFPPPRMISPAALLRYAQSHFITCINNDTTSIYWCAVYNCYSDMSLRFILDTIASNDPVDVHKVFNLSALYNSKSLRYCDDHAQQLFFLKRLVEEFRGKSKVLPVNKIDDTAKKVWKPVWQQLQRFYVSCIHH